jgi:hypothetical protein
MLHQKNLIALLLLFNLTASGQIDSAAIQKTRWYVPSGVVVEYAGGFGMLSAGAIFKPLKKTELGVTIGYTPPEYGNIWTLNFNFSYSPCTLKLTNRVAISPINIGVFTSFHFGENIYIIRPSKYPDRYYWWNSSIRFGPFAEADLEYTTGEKNQSFVFFFQCSTNDLYMSSFITNPKYITVGDILVFGLGGKFIF